MSDKKASVREHPIVAQYLVTIEAPSQATPDAEMVRVAKLVPDMLVNAFAEKSSSRWKAALEKHVVTVLRTSDNGCNCACGKHFKPFSAWIDHVFSSLEDAKFPDFLISIEPVAVGVTCAWCATPVLEQVASAARSNTEIMAAMERVEKHRVELQGTLDTLRKLALGPCMKCGASNTKVYRMTSAANLFWCGKCAGVPA